MDPPGEAQETLPDPMTRVCFLRLEMQFIIRPHISYFLYELGPYLCNLCTLCCLRDWSQC